jgi:hypothetical protein
MILISLSLRKILKQMIEAKIKVLQETAAVRKHVVHRSQNTEEFEQDWRNAISGEEMLKRVHRHIDDLYVQTSK